VLKPDRPLKRRQGLSPRRGVVAAFGLLALSLSSCRAPDTQALKKIACEQAAASLDMQSVSQMDALRKALGVAPDVDPIQACTQLGANMKPSAEGQ
jgi:hypothetical protein